LGVSDQGIKKAAESFGLNVEIQNESSFEDIKDWLDKKVLVIVSWFTRGRQGKTESDVPDGHFSVVVGSDEEFIYLQDLEIGNIRKIKRDDFSLI